MGDGTRIEMEFGTKQPNWGRFVPCSLAGKDRALSRSSVYRLQGGLLRDTRDASFPFPVRAQRANNGCKKGKTSGLRRLMD